MPPRWDDEKLTTQRHRAIQLFREERTTEPLDHYLAYYEQAYRTFAEVMEETHDLRRAREHAAVVLTDKERQRLCRYIASPPLSEDDLATLAGCSLAPSMLTKHRENNVLVMELILMGLDRCRFPWVTEDRDATAGERETAIVSTAAMYAMRRTETWRRGLGRSLEQQLKDYLTSIGLVEAQPETIANSSHGPREDEFCGETTVVGGKADVVVKLYDGRLMPIECKVSNSETNSYKRLIHDCGEKAQAWVQNLGPANCLPAAVLSGCYSLGNLRKAQDEMGLTLIWSHELEPLGEFIKASATR